MQLPLLGNLAKRKTLRANRQAATTATTAIIIIIIMATHPLPLIIIKNKGAKKLVLPEVLQNISKESNRNSLNNRTLQEKLRPFKSPANSKSPIPCPLNPRSRLQISLFLLFTPYTKTEIVKLFPPHKLTLTKISCPMRDQPVAKITTQSDLLQ